MLELKKLTIIGGGNAAMISAMHFNRYTDFEIEIIYDEKIKPLDVGMGMTLSATRLFEDYYDHIKMVNLFDATIKKGILYENWAKSGQIFHPFFNASSAYHVNVKKIREHYFSQNHKIINKNFNGNYSEIDSDFIIDCTGYDKSQEYEKLVSPVNKCGLFTEPKINERYSFSIAKKYGWIFKIPLQNFTACGYIFNDEFENEIDYIFDSVIPINSYVSKNLFIDDRVALNGNKYFFLEPLEATALCTFEQISRCIYDKFIYGYDKSTLTKKTFEYVKDIEAFISLHYFTQNKIFSEFWDNAKTITKNIDYNYLKEKGNFGQWGISSLNNWLSNF